MFYYSETKYLYEAEGSRILPGMKGFVKITFRGTKGVVTLHLQNQSKRGREEVKAILYMASGERPLREILLKEQVLENGRLQFYCVLEETFQENEEIWFGCLIRMRGRRYTEDSPYTEGILTYGTDRQDNLIRVDFGAKKKQETADFAIAEYAREYYVDLPGKLQNEYEEMFPADRKREAGAQIRQRAEEWEQKEQSAKEAQVPKEPEREERKEQSAKEAQVPKEPEYKEENRTSERPECIWDEIYITDLNELEKVGGQWNSFMQNSFLLHGFYNYKHVIATKTLLGVPGNYFEREKKVAGMFGFNSFLSPNELESYLTGEEDFLEDKIEAGTFGYYLCQIPAR